MVRLVAEQGNGDAQLNLGVMHYNGRGVPKNYARAYKWLSLSAVLGPEDGARRLDEVASDMASDQIAEAQRLATEWWEDYQSRQ